jgi:aminoglycoside 2''-phosphotransferase
MPRVDGESLSGRSILDRYQITISVFLKQMHSIPLDKVEAAAIQQSETVRTVEEQLQFNEDGKTVLFPLMWADGREWVRRLFVPFLEDHTFLDYRPASMNGDLGVYHLLFDRQTNQFNGIIDFGTAGIGDPAQDFGILINQYGESFLPRMSHIYPEIAEYIDRARFYAGRIELEWILRGIREEEDDMFVVHIGRARDAMPVGSSWQ